MAAHKPIRYFIIKFQDGKDEIVESFISESTKDTDTKFYKVLRHADKNTIHYLCKVDIVKVS